MVFGSFSKYFSMTGWRLGWMLVPEDLRRPVDVLTGNFTICPPVLSQYAAIAAFTPESYAELDGHVARYATNRALLLDGLPRLGIDKLAPADGAFYVYADIGHLTDDSYAWCLRLLDETGRGHRARHRLRHPPGQRVRPALLRRQRRGDHRGPRPARGLALRLAAPARRVLGTARHYAGRRWRHSTDLEASRSELHEASATVALPPPPSGLLVPTEAAGRVPSDPRGQRRERSTDEVVRPDTEPHGGRHPQQWRNPRAARACWPSTLPS